MAAVLADITVAMHIFALLFIGLGGFLAWRWPKLVFVHIFFAMWGVLVNVFPLPCGITALENYFRRQQGLGDLPGGFNEYYLYDTIIPRSMLPLAAMVAFALVVFSYAGAYLRWRRSNTSAGVPAHRVRLN